VNSARRPDLTPLACCGSLRAPLALAARSACGRGRAAGGRSGRRDGRAQAALGLAALLLALPLAHSAPRAARCAAPAEVAAEAGHTTSVRCDGGPAVSGPARLVLGLGLDPNTADAASLETLPGIGPARAQAIVATRCARRFASPRELDRVPGIGPVGRARLEPWLAIDPAAEPACPLLYHGAGGSP